MSADYGLVILTVGDILLYNGRECPIVEIAHDCVVVIDGHIRHTIFCTDIINRKIEYVIEFKKGGQVGYSRSDSEESAEREKDLLASMGWNTKIFRKEVKRDE